MVMLVLSRYMAAASLIAATLIFTSLVLPNKLNAWKIAVISLLVTLVTPIRDLLGITDGVTIAIIVLLTNVLLASCIPVLFFEGAKWKRYMVFLSFWVLAFFADALNTFIAEYIYVHLDIVLFEQYLLIGHWITMSLYIVCGALAVVMWRMIAAHKFQPFFLLMFISPFGQAMVLYSFIMGRIANILATGGIFISLLGNLIVLVYVMSLDKKAAIEEELTETRHTMELEQQHYRKLELHRKELTDIRHDFNNQLATIGQLIRSGEERSAQDMIHSLSREIMKTAENPFCNIPVINAILTEKAQTCIFADIDLTIELNLPDMLPVENIHLCSIFGNLLDNAINACKAAAYDAPSIIHLSTMMDGDYLFIKVTNPSIAPPAKPAPGRGYGSRILSDLSQRYDGDYWTEYKNGMFTAVVSLVVVR